MANHDERVEFPSADGTALRGTLVLPEGRPRASALFAHCFTCDSRSHAASRVSRALAARGWAVLRFDFTGLGASDGDFAETTFTSNIGDLRAAAAYLAGRFGGPALLVGHSLGGAAAIAAAAEIDTVAAVVTIGAPADPAHVLRLLSDVPASGSGRATVSIGGRPFEIGSQLIDDLCAQASAEAASRLRRPLLILHSPIDAIVGVDNARELYDQARHPKSFVSLDGADHLLTRPADAEYVADVVAAWSARYLPAQPPDRGNESWDVATVVEDDPAGLSHTAGIGLHRWTIDEPRAVGGTDRGPDPYATLLSALGACTSMTMRLYARRKGWEFGATRVELEHARIHAADCADCETTTGFVDRVQRTIICDPALSAEQRQRLLEIADRCPVHRTLSGEVRIETRVAE